MVTVIFDRKVPTYPTKGNNPRCLRRQRSQSKEQYQSHSQLHNHLGSASALFVGHVSPAPLPNLRIQRGFSYVEVLVAMFIIALTMVPAMDALQSGMQGAVIHQQSTQQHYALLNRMETMMAESYGSLLLAAETAGNSTTATSYSDPGGQTDRIVVYLSLYDADVDPFILIDPNTDGDNNIYTGDTARLLWIKVQLENSAYAFESLRSR
jgi:type II secretory pathway pseudopilin PulG